MSPPHRRAPQHTWLAAHSRRSGTGATVDDPGADELDSYLASRSDATMTSPAGSRIGTLRERPLHAGLRRWYAQPGDQSEVEVDDFVIDLVRGELLIEIQTRSFSSIRRKVDALLEHGHRVRIVQPVALDTWIVRLGDDGTVIGRRRSPRHGRASDACIELVSLAALLAQPRLELDLVLIEMEELRRHAPDGPWRRGGWGVEERRLVGVLDIVPIRRTTDLAALLPAGLPRCFTSADLAARLERPRRVAQQVAYCLRLAGVIEAVGSRGGSQEFRRS
jgi:hypothetical protein